MKTHCSRAFAVLLVAVTLCACAGIAPGSAVGVESTDTRSVVPTTTVDAGGLQGGSLPEAPARRSK